MPDTVPGTSHVLFILMFASTNYEYYYFHLRDGKKVEIVEVSSRS